MKKTNKYKKYKIGDLVVWKDRPNRVRVMEYTKYGMDEARRVEYSKKYKDYDLKNYRILQLDMNPFNFRKDNLVKLSVLEMNSLLTNKLLSKTNDYKYNKKHNKNAILIIKNMILEKKIKEVIENEREN